MSRRTGSITQRADGLFQVAWWEDTPQGPKRRYAYAPTKTAAKQKLTKALAEVAAGRTGKDSRQTFTTYADSWEATTLPLRDLSPATVRTYKQTLKSHLKPSLGHLQLGQIKKTSIEKMLGTMRAAGKSPASQRTAFTVLSLILDSAVADALIGHNPCTLVPRPKARTVKPATYVPSDQAQAYLDATSGNLRATLAILITTGCRIGEALGTSWSDFQQGVWHIPGTKTDSSKRAIPIPAELTPELRAWKAEQASIQLASIVWEDSGRVITNAIGQPADYSWLRRQLNEACDQAGLPRVNFHAFRHGSATALLEAGVPMKVVSDLLGHASTRITADIYSHVTPRLVAQATDILGAQISGK